eukprot:gene18693-1910_t
MQIVKKIEDTQDHCAMLTHVPHGNEDGVLLRSITGFLLGTLRYQYHGAGFDYECTGGGWHGRGQEVEYAYSALLGAPWATLSRQPPLWHGSLRPAPRSS